MNKTDVWAQIWPNPHPDGKVHRSVVNGQMRQIGLFTSFETIIRIVSGSGITDLSDQIATARAIRDVRNEWRKSYDPTRRALEARKVLTF